MRLNYKYKVEMHINSKATDIHADSERIYHLISDCQGLKQFLPEQIQDWEAGENYCQFNVAGIATLKMEITERVEFSKVSYLISNDKQIPIHCLFTIETKGMTSDLNLAIDAEVPLFLQAMLKNPLQKFADVIVDKLKQNVEL